jgi:hypothetical protein
LPLRRGPLELRRGPGGGYGLQLYGLPGYGTLWAYDYEGERIRVSGPTRAYARGRSLEFHFCPDCGCMAFWRGNGLDEKGRRRIAVNLRLAAPEAVGSIAIDHFDGLTSFEDLPRDGRCVADIWF